jgi:hypothetical protein
LQPQAPFDERPGCTWSGTVCPPFAARISSKAFNSPSEWSK